MVGNAPGAPKLTNVILLVADPERSVAFYRDVLGLSLSGVSGEFSFLDGGGVTVALRRHDGEVPTGGVEVAFQVDDIHAAYAELSGRGVEFRVAPRQIASSAGRAFLACDFRDPDGHVLSLTGWED